MMLRLLEVCMGALVVLEVLEVLEVVFLFNFSLDGETFILHVKLPPLTEQTLISDFLGANTAARSRASAPTPSNAPRASRNRKPVVDESIFRL